MHVLICHPVIAALARRAFTYVPRRDGGVDVDDEVLARGSEGSRPLDYLACALDQKAGIAFGKRDTDNSGATVPEAWEVDLLHCAAGWVGNVRRLQVQVIHQIGLPEHHTAEVRVLRRMESMNQITFGTSDVCCTSLSQH